MTTEMEKIRTFLDSMSYKEKRCTCLDMKEGRDPFITISRQTGAGGHTLALDILDEITKQKRDPIFEGWKMFDEELCKRVVEDPELKVSMNALLGEEYRSQMEDLLDEILIGLTPQEVIVKKIFDILRTLATFGRSILVGRGGACLTRDLPLGIHVRLVASPSSRIQRMMKLMNLSEAKARELVAKQDTARAQLVKTYFHKDINDPLLYDVIWNTDTVPLPEIARSVVNLVKAKSCHSLV